MRRRGSILCAITQHGWKEISSMKRTTKKTLFVFVLIAAMMLSIFPAAAFAEGAAAVEPAAQTEQQPEKDAAPAAKDDGEKPAEPAKDDGAKPAEPVKDGENKAEPVKNDEKSVVVEGKDGEKPADPETKDGEEKGEPEVKNDDKKEATLVFDPNAGTNIVNNMPVPNPMTGTPEEGKTTVSFPIPTTEPTREGYEFQGWNTAADNTGTSYQPGNNIDVSVGTTGTLYAIWGDKSPETDKAYAVLIYDGNGGTDTVTNVPASATSDAGNVGTNHEFTVSDAVPVRESYTFKGWKDDNGKDYKAGNTIEVPYGETTTLKAQWVKNVKLEIIYNGNADGVQNIPGPDVEWVEPNGRFVFTIAEGPTRPGYRFVEWNTADNGTGDSIKPGQTTLLYAGETGYSKTYYAKWEPEEVTPVDWGKLGISKSVSPTGPVKPGTTLTYTITVTNNTGADLINVFVKDLLPSNVTYVGSNGTGVYVLGIWAIGPLANGASASIEIKVTVNANVANGIKITNTASIISASTGNETKEFKPGPSASATVVVTNPGSSGIWGGTTWGKGVQTGDDANLGLWIAAMIVSFLCVAALVYVNRKRIFKGKANNK